MIKNYATFQAPRFLDSSDEADSSLFRGKTLSECLAQGLRALNFEVGEVFRVYKGCFYARNVEVNGTQVSILLNWDGGLKEWSLIVGWMESDLGPETQNLCESLYDLLNALDGVYNVEWHTGDEWFDRAESHAPEANL